MLYVRSWLCCYSCSTCTYRKISGDSKTITPLLLSSPESLAILHYILLLNILKAEILWLIFSHFHSRSAVLHEEYKMFAVIERLWWTFFNIPHTHRHTYTHRHAHPYRQETFKSNLHLCSCSVTYYCGLNCVPQKSYFKVETSEVTVCGIRAFKEVIK